jgi:hypothetical protein
MNNGTELIRQLKIKGKLSRKETENIVKYLDRLDKIEKLLKNKQFKN